MSWSSVAASAAVLLASCSQTDAFVAPAAFGARASSRAATRGTPLSVYMDAALILQNKGGGHGEIGFHMAKQLKDKGLDVTLMQDSAAKMDKNPFSSYGDLGVEVVTADLSNKEEVQSKVAGKSFTHVFDNFSKDVGTCTLAETAKTSWGVKSYVYVSSGGMYEASNAQPMKEDGATKATGQRGVEEHLDGLGLPWTSFRPQYIYGPKTNKRDYLDWFIDRVVRDRTCPLPGDGKQLASVTNCEDVAAMMTSVVGKEEAAAKQVFNCGTDDLVSYEDICSMVAKVAGKQAKTMTYDPKNFDLPKGSFPFRNTEFAVTPDKAKSILGWSPKNRLEADLPWYYQQYIDAGLDKKDIKFEADETIMG
eukprot:CAMPEP_0173420062 /NCGR_PEP_ID=MMETSP1357-20121228/1690_1 /TAXON_ID=77926 /ORGANISM="Hemiselmis rufescens, Strain PCC563" /LENGTH=363 /DNA_ID=CAMNT_0014382809 /DNA_START=19 /DNA_END=1110 /DNA_ORIENTATION=-